jgi:NAD(P)-dependent dehydrogenase (short-subunit alcohol dehydrogenase family)
MGELRLDGRTAVVTGAGGNPSLGRAHALLLGRLGANVVVNDLGPGVETPGYADVASAEAVAEEIRAAGGKAVADTNSVAGVESAQAIVQTALDAFGRIDILVNNAAFSITAAFDELTPRDFERHVQVNLMGAVWTCRAAWPHMKAQRYGRIVNTASSGLAGAGGLSAYGATKGGIFSLSRQLASEGEPFGIKVNTINPGGFSRLVMATQRADSEMYKWTRDNFSAELSSPAVAFLAHEDCPVSGECIESFAGTVRRMYLAVTEGFSDPAVSIDMIAERWAEVMGKDNPAAVGIMRDEILSAARPYDPATRD